MYLFMSYCMLFFTKVNQESSKPRLVPLNEGGVSELLNKVNPEPHKLWVQFTFIFKIKWTQHNATCVSHLALQEITRLQEENEKLKSRLRNLESQVEQHSVCPLSVCSFSIGPIEPTDSDLLERGWGASCCRFLTGRLQTLGFQPSTLSHSYRLDYPHVPL